jgi:very-short-patch-repair endonuclease
LSVNYDLPVETDDFERHERHTDRKVQTLHYADELDARLRKIRAAGRTAIEESGANMLYLAFAFLEWRDQQTSKGHQAPLILMPVELQRETGRGGQYRTRVKWTGEELQPNLSLEKKLEEFNIALPELAEDQKLEDYLTSVGRAIKDKPNWLIRRYVTLGLFEFGKILLYRDLDPTNWPVTDPLTASRLIKRILLGENQDAEGGGAISTPDLSPEALLRRDVNLEVVDRADSSQCEALDVALSGRDLVIQGPPGTGKSQTITNLVAASLARGKTVLFVAEKLAALEVVRRRMRELGLGDFCLELHSHKTRKLEVLEDIADRIKVSAQFRPPAEYESAITRLKAKRTILSEYIETIGGQAGSLSGFTVSDSLLQAGRARRKLGPLVKTLEEAMPIGELARIGWADFAEAKGRVRRLANAVVELGSEGPVISHPWAGISSTKVFPYDQEQVVAIALEWACSAEHVSNLADDGWGATPPEEFRVAADSFKRIAPLRGHAAEAELAAKFTEELLGERLPRNAEGAGLILAAIDLVLSQPLVPTGDIRNYCLNSGAANWLRAHSDRIRDIGEKHSALGEYFRESAFSLDPDDIEEWVAVFSQKNPLSRLGNRWRSAKQSWSTICRPSALNAPRATRVEHLTSLRSYLLQVLALRNDFTAQKNLGELGTRVDADLAPFENYARWADQVRTKLPERVVVSFFQSASAAMEKVSGISRQALGEIAALPVMHGGSNFWSSIVEFFVPASFAEAALSAESAESWQALEKKAYDLSIATTKMLEVERQFCETTALNSAWWFGLKERPTAAAIASRAKLAAAHCGSLNGWLEFDRVYKSCTGGVEVPLLEHCIEGAIPPHDLITALEFIVYDGLARQAFNAKPALLMASRPGLEAARSEYASLDAEVMELRREHIASTLARQKAPRGRQSGTRSELTEMALIRAELAKKTRHLPIRQLIARAGRSIQTLKPCFMMGPLSVAQYIAPGTLKFDLVIMDEASQMRPEDAIGALARGGQAIIVGDSKQLPPTSFFDRIAESGEEEEEELTLAEDANSILDLGEAIFDQRVLKWHYRSRHEALIAFSNKHFYKNELIVFPSPAGQSDRFGLGFRFVPNATASKGLNAIEAKVVAEAAAQFLLTEPGRSLGVVAMNVRQAERISDELAKLAGGNPDLAKALADSENSKIGEPFFIKNLENVQGDERDVIMISMTYAPATLGSPVPQNFGPINRDTGWRRLNVLFTRAKERMEIISSMRSSDIKPKEGADSGPRALKHFLEYAETGRLDGNVKPSSRPTGSDLEDAVLEGLREMGFDCEPQLGVANFFLDIAIRDPDFPEEFVAAVECDGAAYHSSKSARDRDRLRQEILENLGWEIRRVWSTDWFRNPQGELERITKEIRQLIEGRRERRANGGAPTGGQAVPTESQAKSQLETKDGAADPGKPRRRSGLSLEQARAHLIDLRERKIKVEFPDVDAARGFLRKTMLDELLRKRPTDMDEFRQLVPLAIREKTAAEQVKAFHQEVFDILAQVFETAS